MVGTVRLIARLDIKGPNLIKGMQFDGLRVLGTPQEFARRYYDQGADELIYVDSVASLYRRDNLSEIVEQAAREVFVPLTVAGGVRNIDDAKRLMRCGADKIAVNTHAIETPHLISQLAEKLGSQAVVLSIEAKRKTDGGWEAYTKGGRERSHLDAVEWAAKGEALGAGEILLTSVDRDGTRKGLDQSLITAVSDSVNLPVIASGGLAKSEEIVALNNNSGISAFAMASCLHYGSCNLETFRRELGEQGVPVRKIK